MATTDLHMQALPYDYYTDKDGGQPGLSRTALLIRKARAEAANSLLFDNGDLLQGNPMGDYIATERGLRPGETHPLIAAMNALGYDAATLGNHDFNYGLDFLLTCTAAARLPVVLANLAHQRGADPAQDRRPFPAYALLDRDLTDGAGRRHPLRIGVIGLTPPQVMTWDRQHLAGRVEARDIVETARALVPRMRAEGAQIVVALSHSGIGPDDTHRPGMENASVPLARIAGIDALVTGHSHLVFPGPAFAGQPGIDADRGLIHGKPAVMAGVWGSHLGVIDLLLDRVDEGDGGTGSGTGTGTGTGTGWRIREVSVAARPVGAAGPDAPEQDTAVVAAVRQDHARTLDYIRRPVGHSAVPLTSYFARVRDDPSVRLVAVAQRWYMARLLAQGPLADLPLLSAAAPFKAGGRGGPWHYTDVPAGPLALRHIADLYVYPNTLRAIRITGAQLRDWLERAAGQFNRIAPGAQDAPLENPVFAAYDFDTIDGVCYRIDLSSPPRFHPDGRLADASARRIRGLTHAGRPVTDDMAFAVVTNNYRAAGGGAFPGAGDDRDDRVVQDCTTTNREAILHYLRDTGPDAWIARGLPDRSATAEPPAAPLPAPPARTAAATGALGGWSFLPMPGTSVVFDTGPMARAHPETLAALGLHDLGDTATGFARFRLRL